MTPALASAQLKARETMSFASLTCPYCNAPATIPPGTKVGQRIPCTRCGDSFALRPGQQAFTATPPASLPTISEQPLHRPTPRRNWLVGGTVLGVMVVMATVSLTFA